MTKKDQNGQRVERAARPGSSEQRETPRMTNKEAIDRWAEYIIPAVFKAEDALKRAHPEWEARLRALGQPDAKEDPHTVARDYCRAIATIIVRTAEDYDPTDTSDL